MRAKFFSVLDYKPFFFISFYWNSACFFTGFVLNYSKETIKSSFVISVLFPNV